MVLNNDRSRGSFWVDAWLGCVFPKHRDWRALAYKIYKIQFVDLDSLGRSALLMNGEREQNVSNKKYEHEHVRLNSVLSGGYNWKSF